MITHIDSLEYKGPYWVRTMCARIVRREEVAKHNDLATCAICKKIWEDMNLIEQANDGSL